MKRACVFAALLLVSSSAFAAGYYATKADERAGILTPGDRPLGPGDLLKAGTDSCPGTTIPDPGAATFNDTGTTIGADNTVGSIQAGCSNYMTNAGPDVVYQFDLGALGSRGTPLTIVVTPTGGTGYDPSIYTLSTAGGGCPAGTGNVVTNCVNGADAAFANGAETITDGETDAMAAGHYFLFIDAFFAPVPDGAGAYSLAFGTGPFPAELITFEVD